MMHLLYLPYPFCSRFEQTTLKGGKDLLTYLQLPLPEVPFISSLFANDNDATPSPEPPAAPVKQAAKPASKPAAKGGQLSVFEMDAVNQLLHMFAYL
jgi:hypothetical protein